MLRAWSYDRWVKLFPFQWAPTLVGECYEFGMLRLQRGEQYGFNGHPPLWVNATDHIPQCVEQDPVDQFQWAPTLVGECYSTNGRTKMEMHEFQWAPTLVGECYTNMQRKPPRFSVVSMGTHPWG